MPRYNFDEYSDYAQDMYEMKQCDSDSPEVTKLKKKLEDAADFFGELMNHLTHPVLFSEDHMGFLISELAGILDVHDDGKELTVMRKPFVIPDIQPKPPTRPNLNSIFYKN